MDFGQDERRTTVSERLCEIDVFGRDAARREKFGEERRFSDTLMLEAIKEEPARWLLDRIAGGDTLNPCTLALLQRLRNDAGKLDPYLAQVLEQLAL